MARQHIVGAAWSETFSLWPGQQREKKGRDLDATIPFKGTMNGRPPIRLYLLKYLPPLHSAKLRRFGDTSDSNYSTDQMRQSERLPGLMIHIYIHWEISSYK
jgi:hypothetical protein